MIPGFWQIFFRKWKDIFVQLDFLIAVLVGLSCGLFPDDKTVESRFELILATQIGVAIGLLGLVLAGLALVIAFLGDDLIALLHSRAAGLSEDVWPFSLTSLLAVLTTLVASLVLAIVSANSIDTLRAGLGLATGLFTWTMLSVLSLIRVVYLYGTVRAAHVASLHDDSTQ